MQRRYAGQSNVLEVALQNMSVHHQLSFNFKAFADGDSFSECTQLAQA